MQICVHICRETVCRVYMVVVHYTPRSFFTVIDASFDFLSHRLCCKLKSCILSDCTALLIVLPIDFVASLKAVFSGCTGWRRFIRCLICIGHFRQRALELVALLRKMTCNLRLPVHLRHPVWIFCYDTGFFASDAVLVLQRFVVLFLFLLTYCRLFFPIVSDGEHTCERTGVFVLLTAILIQIATL